MFSSFREKLSLKMGNTFHEISTKPLYVRTEVGGLSQKRTRAYRVGGLVKNMTILSVRTLWLTLISWLTPIQKLQFKVSPGTGTVQLYPLFPTWGISGKLIQCIFIMVSPDQHTACQPELFLTF